MENFSELIKNRRSMRKFTDEELTQDEVVALMKAALFLIFSICAGVFKSFLEGTISPLSLCSFIFSSIGIWHFLYFLPLPHQQGSFLSMFSYLLQICFVLRCVYFNTMERKLPIGKFEKN